MVSGKLNCAQETKRRHTALSGPGLCIGSFPGASRRTFFGKEGILEELLRTVGNLHLRGDPVSRLRSETEVTIEKTFAR